MPISQLPTVKDVISHINYLKNSAKRMKKTTLAEATTVLICGIWKKTDIPIINRKSIINRVNRFIEKNRSNVKQTKKIDKKQDCSQLFLLSKCRCDLISVVTGNIKCSCRKEDQVPPSIIPFLIDQSDTKNGRKMLVDYTPELSRQRKTEESVMETNEFENDYPANETSEAESTTNESPSSSDDDYVPQSPSKKPRYNKKPLPSLSEAADRYHVSDRVAASLANAVLKDMGVVTREDNNLVIARNKMRRQRLSLGAKQAKVYTENLGKICGLYFDGKRDDTLARDVVSNEVSNSDRSSKNFKQWRTGFCARAAPYLLWPLNL